MAKIKRIVEIDEEVYNAIMCEPECPVFGWYEIAHSVPYNPTEDLISREALKNAIRNPNDKRYLSENLVRLFFERIDNTPTVEAYTPEQVKELVDLNKKLSEERPQSEWIEEKTSCDIGHTFYYCSKCNREIDLIDGESLDDYPFCHCGAKMQKGGDKNGE